VTRDHPIADDFELHVEGVTYRCCPGPPFCVRNASGEILNPVSAAVLTALGGAEPRWLPTVDALTRVHDLSPDDPTALAEAASALRAGTRQVQLASSTTSRAQLIALASVGTISAAANPACDIEIWNLLLYHRDMRVGQRALAQHKALPPALARHPDVQTRIRVARNTACSAEQLRELSADPQVTMQVAGNPSADARTLNACAADERWQVRQAVASNPSCPVGIIDLLLRDRTAQVRAAMVRNPIVPGGILRTRLHDRTSSVHEALATRVELYAGNLRRVEHRARADERWSYQRTHKALVANPRSGRVLRRRLARIETKLASLTDAERQALEAEKARRRDGGSFAYCGVYELVTFWALILLIAGLVFAANRVAIADLALVAVALAALAFIWLRGPFLHWYPAALPRVLRPAMPIGLRVAGVLVAFVASNLLLLVRLLPSRSRLTGDPQTADRQ